MSEQLRDALIGAANYIDNLGGDSKKYRAALSTHHAAPGALQQEASGEPTPEQLSEAFTKAHGGPNPYYRCKQCGEAEPGLEEYLVAHWKSHRAAATAPANIVPGQMHCARCKFQLTRTTLYLGNGAVGAGDNKTEPCPNGCGPLWPVTWEQACRDAWATGEALFERAKKAEDALAAVNPPRLVEPATAPAGGVHEGYKAFLLAEFGPGLGQDRVQFSIGNVARAFNAGAALTTAARAAAPAGGMTDADRSAILGLAAYAEGSKSAEVVRWAKDARAACERLTTTARAAEPEPWVPYLLDRADGVRGHYCIARMTDKGIRETWSPKRESWGAFSDTVFVLGKTTPTGTSKEGGE